MKTSQVLGINLLKIFISCFLVVILNAQVVLYEPLNYKIDDAKELAINKRVKGSHLNIYIPILPYAYIFRLINGTLLRLNGSTQGWEYYYAVKHEKVNATTYDFTLRENVKFQDGTPFSASSVVENFEYFLSSPYSFTFIGEYLKSVEKIDKYKVRFHLKKAYPFILNDLGRIGLYSSNYLKNYGFNDGSTVSNTEKIGLFGLGPYVLKEGIALGNKQSSKIELKYNKYFYDKKKPTVESLSVYTKLPSNKVVNDISQKEGKLDIAYIPFNKKVEVLDSKYSKLIIRPSRASYSIQMNLLKEDGVLEDQKVRQALNQIINQKNLIKFVYKNEGKYSPFPVSSNMSEIDKMTSLYKAEKRFTEEELKKILNGLSFNILTQDIFLELWKGIEYQLEKYNVKFNYEVSSNEKDILNKLFKNKKQTQNWDMLIWGNSDWFGNNPWNLFMLLKSTSSWSAINDMHLDSLLKQLVTYEKDSKEYKDLLKKIIMSIQEKSYILNLPSPNIVMALNKEVFFEPSSSGILPVWNAKITPYHWSIREGEYPKNRQNPILPIRLPLEN